jgi:hypothetical protein
VAAVVTTKEIGLGQDLDSGGECGVPAQNMFYVPAENREQFWYENFPPGYSQDFFEGKIWSRLKT